MTHPARVLIVDDERMFADALRALLAGEGSIQTVLTAGTAEEAIDLCRSDCPDVVLMDIDLPGMSGVEATWRVREICPDTQVVAITALRDRALVGRAIRAGACGFVPKTRAADDLVEVLRLAAQGEMVLPSDDLRVLADILESDRRPRPRIDTTLTAREVEILQAFAELLSTGEVASRLFISPRTVNSHVSSILGKLGVRSKLEAVLMCLQEGIVRLPEGERHSDQSPGRATRDA